MSPKAVASLSPDSISVDDDHDTGDRLLPYVGKTGVEVSLRISGDTFWASQAQMAEMFGIDRSGVTKHIGRVLADGELPEEGNVHLMHITKGRKPTKLYSLNMMISVGYRVESKQGTLFRIWATDKLVQYLTKGFVIDDERLKNPDGLPDHFDELLERIRDIRSSEKRMWTRVLELAAFCGDYDAKNRLQNQEFFAEIQNTMHWAVHQRTAPEMVMDRVHASKEHAGVMTFKGKMPTVEEAGTAKNLLQEPEIKALNHITTLVLEFFESQAEQGKLTTLAQFLAKMRDLVNLDGRPLKKPGYTGTVTRKKADAWVSKQIKAYKTRMRKAAEIEGEKLLAGVASAIKANRRKKAS